MLPPPTPPKKNTPKWFITKLEMKLNIFRVDLCAGIENHNISLKNMYCTLGFFQLSCNDQYRVKGNCPQSTKMQNKKISFYLHHCLKLALITHLD